MALFAAEAGQTALETEAKENTTGGIERKSTRAWAQDISYNPEKLFNKVLNVICYNTC